MDRTLQCTIHPTGHILTYDASQSDSTKNVYVCDCTHQVIEWQDSAP